MSFGETIFLFFLALIIFGPKKLPEIARQIGKYLNEFKRASNEFKAQIEQEISHLETEKNETEKNQTEKYTTQTPSLNALATEPAAVIPYAPATLAAPVEPEAVTVPRSANAGVVATEAVGTPESMPASQESHA